MKKLTLILLASFVGALALCAADRDADSMLPDPDHTMGKGLFRGFVNLTCGSIEIPARMSYYSQLFNWYYIPYGLPMGIIDGCNFTLLRAAGSLYDFLFLGLPARNHTAYTLFEIPTLPWDTPWKPTPDEIKELDW